MNVIVDEKEEVKLTKEEKLLLALNECSNKELYEKARFLYKFDLYSKEIVEKFDEEAYIEVYPKQIKGYSLVTNEQGDLFLVKELQADSEADSYGYEVLSLANPTDDEMKVLLHHHRPVCILKYVILVTMLLFLGLGFYSFFVNFFDYLQDYGFNATLFNAFDLSGGYIIIGLGLLLLYLKKGKCNRK